MKKTFTILLLSVFIVGFSNAQLKQIELEQRDLSKYKRHIEKGSLSSSSNYNNAPTRKFSPLPSLKNGQFSDYLSAQYSGERPILISGIIKGSDTRDINYASFEYLMEAKDMMNIMDPINEFVQIESIVDEKDNRHIKMQQVYLGIPVYGKQVILHEDRGQFVKLNGVFSSTPKLDNIKPTISIEQNKELVKEGIAVEIKPIDHSLPGHDDLEQWTEELVILASENNEFKLAYHNTVYTNLFTRVEIFIDAITGEVIDKFESLCKLHNHFSVGHEHIEKGIHSDLINVNIEDLDPTDGPVTANVKDLYNNTVTINVYDVSNKFYMVDASRSMFSNSSNMPDQPRGAIWTIDAFNTNPANNNFGYDHVTSNNNSWNGANGAVSAHYNGGKAYDYYKNTHGRNSIDGKGGNVISFVNISDEDGNSMGNAFWNGQAMFYGNGDNSFKPLARSLDVAGHEMSHGVVQNTANLVYQGEAGAINESMADVFGVMMDREDWKLGEDVVKTSVFTSGALRDLQNPHNGQATDDYAHGYQPKHVNEKYTGSQDNGGVHLNSGIPNHAFYLFANAVGKSKAEKVYYKALSQYLTKSSQFADLRIAVVQAATDLYGQTEVNAAKDAFQGVGIGEGSGGDYETDYEENPGQEFLVVADKDLTKLVLLDKDRNIISNPFSETAPISKPSISDDGVDILFIGSDKKMHYIKIDWSEGTFNESILEANPIWRNVVISKDGTKIAALRDNETNEIEVYDDISGTWNTYELYNPTYSEGVVTGEVAFADAMEFDASGEWLMYDANSIISGSNGNEISYWDIGFVNVWDNKNDLWGIGQVEKLFSALPDNVSIGNPTFSKNSPYIVAFDFIEGNDYQIVGTNIETNESGSIATDLFRLGYPSYSANDKRMVYDFFLFQTDLGILDLKDNKIDNVNNSEDIYLESAKWGVFFSNGERDLSSINELASPDELSLLLSPNPVKNDLKVSVESKWFGEASIKIISIDGKLVMEIPVQIIKGNNNLNINTQNLNSGSYILQLAMKRGQVNQQLIKID